MKWLQVFAWVLIGFASTAAHSENPWGPECETLEQCIRYLHADSACDSKDTNCLNYEEHSPLQQGLSIEFEKFGKTAVPQLLKILATGRALEVQRAAEVLRTCEDINPSDYVLVQMAWKRMPGTSTDMLASDCATPDFVRELIDELRKKPEENGNTAHVFSNLREFPDEKPNGVISAVIEHIECSQGESCNPVFAKLQIDWISSNVEQYDNVVPRLAFALKNPALDEVGKLAAISYFSPSEYFRTAEKMKDVAVPVVRQQLDSSSPLLRLEAAKILTAYGNNEGAGVLLDLAEMRDFAKRVDALKSLTSIAKDLRTHVPRIKGLLTDDDWNVRRNAVILLGTMGDESTIKDLINQIDPRDWLTTYSAVSALRGIQTKDALDALKQVRESYWHPIVRDLAKKAPSTAPNEPQYPTEELNAVKFTNGFMSSQRFPAAETQDYEITSWCKSRFERDGYKFVPDFITGPEVITQANNAVESNADHVKSMLMNRPEMKGAKQPGRQLDYNDWHFVGKATTNVNLKSGVTETEGSLVAKHGGHPDQVVLPEAIAGIFVWQNQPFAISASGELASNDGFLYRLILRDNNRWQAKAVMRLTGAAHFWSFDPKTEPKDGILREDLFSQVWLGAGQTIGILGRNGVMLISDDGSPQWVGCPVPSFP